MAASQTPAAPAHDAAIPPFRPTDGPATWNGNQLGFIPNGRRPLFGAHQLSFPLVRRVRLLYQQQTRNLLVIHSPPKIGFFERH